MLLVICACLGLCACGKEKVPTAAFTYEDLTIHLPENFIDLSEEAFASGLTFLHGLDPIAINGMREEKALFASYGLELDLEQYAKLVVLSNNLTIQPETKDGILMFSYEALSDGVSYTYVVTLWETQKAFWTVQSYCPTADFPDVQKEIWEIFKDIRV